ncbi:MAG: AI-2E family transporter [Burkholderiales bacterium]|nr:MAG: AI-2E family transporter [Burkholderiales bacterium]
MSDGKGVATTTLVQASVVALVALAVLLLLRAAEAFLAIFGGVLLAILFNGTARWVRDRTGLPYAAALAAATVLPLLLLGLGLWLAAPVVADQAGQLAERVPAALRQLRSTLREWEWADGLLDQRDRIGSFLPDGERAAGLIGGFFSSTFGALGNFVIALAVGLFLAAGPGVYVGGLMRLVPPARRHRTGEVLEAVQASLSAWLLAKIVAMLAIGVLTTLGLWLIGIDLALILGVVAALLSFIPNVGPIIALVPAALIGLVDGPDTLLYVVALYVGIQTVESYLLTPLLQKRMVELPPALTIGVQVVLSVIAGAAGLIFAAPLTAAGMVMVRMWYVEDLLGDRPASG